MTRPAARFTQSMKSEGESIMHLALMVYLYIEMRRTAPMKDDTLHPATRAYRHPYAGRE